MSQTLPKDDVFRENQEHSCTTLALDSSRERGGPEFNEKRIRTRYFYGDDHEGVSRLIHLKLISNGHLMILLWAKQHLAHRLI